jgi:hypothetical protein
MCLKKRGGRCPAARVAFGKTEERDHNQEEKVMPVFRTRVNRPALVAALSTGVLFIAPGASAVDTHFSVQIQNSSQSIDYNGSFDWAGTPNGSNFNFTGQLQDPENIFDPQWALEWNFNGDPNPVGAASMGNNLTIRNYSETETLTFTVTIILDLTAPTSGPITQFAGGVGFNLVTDGAGGQLSAPGGLNDGRALWTPLIDGLEFENLWTVAYDPAELFAAPFSIGSSGAGTTVVSARNFNQPGVTYWGPAATTSIGVKFDVVLTPGDYITDTGTFAVIGAVPGPGGLALVGLSALVGRSRRRRD